MRRLRHSFRRYGRAPAVGMKIRIMAFCIGILTALLILDMQLRPFIKAISSYQAKVYATKVINDAIYEELAKEDIRYDNLITLTQNENGEITSLQTDMVALNQLRSGITDAVLQKIAVMDDQYIKISSGTLSGVSFLSGRGPSIDIKIAPAGYLQTELENKFETAGINQTKHQIMLKMNMRVTAIIPGFSVTTDVITQFCLAETVIVGTVPKAFTQVIGEDTGTTRQIFDYKAMENAGVK